MISLVTGITTQGLASQPQDVPALEPSAHPPDLGAERPPALEGAWQSAAYTTASNTVWSARLIGGTVTASVGGSVVTIAILGAIDAFDQRERPSVGVRSPERTAVGATEVGVLMEMARCLRDISAGRVPR